MENELKNKPVSTLEILDCIIVTLCRLNELIPVLLSFFAKKDRRENAMATFGRHRGEGKIFYVIYYIRVGLLPCTYCVRSFFRLSVYS